MNASLQRQSEDELPEPLKSVMESIVGDQPDELQLDSFLSSLRERQPTRSLPYISTDAKRIRGRLLIWVAATAASIAILIGFQFLPTANALEQIADALAHVRCIKSTTLIDGVETERWVMLKENRSATRNDEWIEFGDGPSKRRFTYDRRNRELVQSILPERIASTFTNELIESLAAAGMQNVSKTILGMSVESAEVKTIDGRRVLQLVLRRENMSASARITLQDNGNLPVAGIVNFSRDGMSQTIETNWEYPQVGPADIFALGVPRDSKLIDRIPTPEVKQLVQDVYQGRLLFDDYRAVVFDTNSQKLHDIDSLEIALVSKKGNRLVRLRNAYDLPEFEGRSRLEVAAELLKKPDSIEWRPATIIKDQIVYRFDNEPAEGGGHLPIRSFRTLRISDSADAIVIPGSDLVPHLVGRPPTGVGRADVGAILESTPDGGPKDCVLLRTFSSLRKNVAVLENGKSTGQRQVSGDYWINRERDSLAVRHHSLWDDETTSTISLDELIQSPRGFWYPTSASRTKLARKQTGDAPKDEDASRQDTVYKSVISYHVDFAGGLPDSMFDPNEYLKQPK